jgi:hypothetical protein
MEETAVAALKSTTAESGTAHLAAGHSALSATTRVDAAAAIGSKSDLAANLGAIGKGGVLTAKLGATAKATASAGVGIAAHLREFLHASARFMGPARSKTEPSKPGHVAPHKAGAKGAHATRAPAHAETAKTHAAGHAKALPKAAHATLGSKGSLGAKGLLLALKTSVSAKTALGVGIGLAGLAVAAHTGTLGAAAHSSSHVVTVGHGGIQIGGSGGVSISIGL